MSTPRIENNRAEIGIDVAAKAAEDFLHALNITTDDETMRGTPRRMAKAYAEPFSLRGRST
jgi:GTP cyclohydrolase I